MRSRRRARPVGYRLAAPEVSLILPMGISFYTFQSMSYTIDVYRGVLAPLRSFKAFFLYIIFFPQLVAGPIVRAGGLSAADAEAAAAAPRGLLRGRLADHRRASS